MYANSRSLVKDKSTSPPPQPVFANSQSYDDPGSGHAKSYGPEVFNYALWRAFGDAAAPDKEGRRGED